jgi:nucleotide-binding universal stress UspA family protein
VRSVLLYAEHVDADLIVCGGSTRGAIARRLLGDVALQLVRRARRPVLVVTGGEPHGS